MMRLTATVILSLVILSSGIFAGGFENTGVGTKAKGMGGAFRAIADDWTAAYYNPAGFAYISDNQLGGTSGFVNFRHEMTPDYRYRDDFGNIYETGIYNDRTLYNQHEVHSMPSGGFAVRVPFWGETVFGLSAFELYDNNLIWTVWESPLAYNDEIADRLFTDQLASDIDVVAFQLTAAREFSEDKFAIGLGLQILRADLFFNDLAFRDNPMDAPLNDRPYDKIPEFSSNDGTGYGFGINLGAMWKLNEKVNVAFTASVPFDITIDGSTTLNYIMPLIEYSDFNSGELGYLFTEGANIGLGADFETELKLPSVFGAGLSYKASDKLTLALDASYTTWSDFEGFAFTYSNFVGLPATAAADAGASAFFTTDLTNPADWDNTLKVALGASYVANDALTFLGGVFMDQSPMSSSDIITPQFVDTGDKLGFNGGFLFSIDRWELGLATSYIHTGDDQTVSGLIDADNDGLSDSFAAVYGASTYETTLSVNYRF